VSLDKVPDGFRITTLRLITVGEVTGIDQEEFDEQAQVVKLAYPVSRTLAGVE
jgi:organic hydroperoxide reductase OsmC/OhrA